PLRHELDAARDVARTRAAIDRDHIVGELVRARAGADFRLLPAFAFGLFHCNFSARSRNAHAKQRSKSPSHCVASMCWVIPASSATAHHGSGGQRSGSVTTGVSPQRCSCRQSDAPHRECAAMPRVAMTTEGDVLHTVATMHLPLMRPPRWY